MADPTPSIRPVKLPRLGIRRKAGGHRPGPVSALEVDGQTLIVVQATSRAGRTAVTRIDTGQLDVESEAGRSDPVALGKAIAETLQDLRLKLSQVVMGVPRHLVVLRTLSVPVIDDVRELASVIHLQIGKDLPFRLEEAIIDFKVHRPAGRSSNANLADPPPAEAPGQPPVLDSTPKLEVLVAAVRRETLEFYQRVADAAKLKLTGLGWLSQANARCLQECRLAGERESVALVSLHPNEVGIDIVAEQCLLFSRGASLQSQDVPAEGAPGVPEESAPSATPGAASDSGGFVDVVTIEVVRSLHSYAGTGAKAPISKVIIAGATGQEAGVLEALQKRLNIPCLLLDPSQALELPETARHHSFGAIGALGLAYGANDPDGLPFDFLSPKRPAVQRNLRRIRTLSLCALGAIVLISLLGLRSHLIKQRLKVINDLQTQWTAAAPSLTAYRRMQLQAAAIQKWEKEGHDWLELYAHLSAVLPGPEDVYITSLSVSGQGNIHLAVQARSGEILASLDRRLREAGYDVKPLAINPGNDKFGYNFRTTVELIVPARLKVDLSKLQSPARPDDDGSLDPKARPNRKGGRS